MRVMKNDCAPCESLVLDSLGHERLKLALATAKEELATIVAQKVEVRQYDNIQSVEDPSSSWIMLLSQEAAKKEEILRIERALANCKVVEEKTYANIVCINDTVTLTFFMDDGEVENNQTYRIVSMAPNHSKHEISRESPIGSSILGRRTGEKVLVKLPENRTMEVLIVSKE